MLSSTSWVILSLDQRYSAMNASNSSAASVEYTGACRNFIVLIHSLVCALLLLCLVGNALSFHAWRKVGGRRGFSSSIVQLMALAVSDTLVTIVTVLVITVLELITAYADGYNYYKDVIFAYLGKYVWALGTIAGCVTTWITTLLGIHRFAILRYPFSLRTKALVSVKNTIYQITGIIVFSVLFNVTGFFEYDIIVTRQDGHRLRTELTYSELFVNDAYNIGFATVTFILVMLIIPLLVSMVLAYKIIRLLINARSTRITMTEAAPGTNNNNKELGVSVTLVTVIIIFIACQTPNAVFRIMLALDPVSSNDCGGKYFHMQQITVLATVFNSSINFCVYGLCCSDFRKELLTMLFCCCHGNRANHSQQQQQQQDSGHTHQTTTSSVMPASTQLTMKYETQL